MITMRSLQVWPRSRALAGGLLLFALSTVATASNVNFGVDPFDGTTVRNIPGRQIVGGEFFIAFHTATEQFVFDGPAFRMSDIRFANGPIASIPSDANAVVLQTLDNDGTAGTPFGAGNAADLLASRITTHGPGVFVYFNSSLNLARLVYSDDLASNSADLRILARILDLNGQQGGVNQLPAFSAANFAITNAAAVPEPSSLALLAGGIALLIVPAVRRASPARLNRRAPARTLVATVVAIGFASGFASPAGAEDMNYHGGKPGPSTPFIITPPAGHSFFLLGRAAGTQGMSACQALRALPGP